MAWAPVICMMGMAHKENWFQGSPVEEDYDTSKCRTSEPTELADTANCWAYEFVNALVVMQEMNQAMLQLDVAEAMKKHYADRMQNFICGTSNEYNEDCKWNQMQPLEMYSKVQAKVLSSLKKQRKKKYRESYLTSQFKAMKLVSVMMPFETFTHVMQRKLEMKNDYDNTENLTIPKPRWSPVYEELLKSHKHETNFEPMQVNIQEAHVGDIKFKCGNDVASDALIEYLKLHGTKLKTGVDEEGVEIIEFPPEWIGLYTLWNHLFVLSAKGSPAASAILYFPRILEDFPTWTHVRTNSLWMLIHTSVLSNSNEMYSSKNYKIEEFGKRIGKITKFYAERMKQTYQIPGKYSAPSWFSLPGIMQNCVKFFFKTFGNETKAKHVNYTNLLRHYWNGGELITPS